MTQGRALTANEFSGALRPNAGRGPPHPFERDGGSTSRRRDTGGRRRDARGSSLIEVLIAVFVLSVGMAGVSTLNVQSKRANHEALQRTTASHLARDIVERMRANRSALDRYVGTVGGQTTAPAIDCVTSPCDPRRLAQFDLTEWARGLSGAEESYGGGAAGGLMQATGCIDGPADGTSGIYTVAIAWRGRSALSDPRLHACGSGSGSYDDSDGNPDVYRRVLVLALFMAGQRGET